MVKVKTFRKKPLEIQAFQVNSLDSQTVGQIEKWVDNDDDYVNVEVCDEDGYGVDYDSDDFDDEADHIEIYSEEKDITLKVYVGDFVVKGMDGSVYPVKEETFKKSYDEVYTGHTEEKTGVFSKAITW